MFLALLFFNKTFCSIDFGCSDVGAAGGADGLVTLMHAGAFRMRATILPLSSLIVMSDIKTHTSGRIFLVSFLFV